MCLIIGGLDYFLLKRIRIMRCIRERTSNLRLQQADFIPFLYFRKRLVFKSISHTLLHLICKHFSPSLIVLAKNKTLISLTPTLHLSLLSGLAYAGDKLPWYWTVISQQSFRLLSQEGCFLQWRMIHDFFFKQKDRSLPHFYIARICVDSDVNVASSRLIFFKGGVVYFISKVHFAIKRAAEFKPGYFLEAATASAPWRVAGSVFSLSWAPLCSSLPTARNPSCKPGPWTTTRVKTTPLKKRNWYGIVILYLPKQNCF